MSCSSFNSVCFAPALQLSSLCGMLYYLYFTKTMLYHTTFKPSILNRRVHYSPLLYLLFCRWRFKLKLVSNAWIVAIRPPGSCNKPCWLKRPHYVISYAPNLRYSDFYILAHHYTASASGHLYIGLTRSVPWNFNDEISYCSCSLIHSL